MLLSTDERELLDSIRNQLEMDIGKGTVDLSDTRFCDYSLAQRDSLFMSLKNLGYIHEFTVLDHIRYQVKMPHDFYIAQV